MFRTFTFDEWEHQEQNLNSFVIDGGQTIHISLGDNEKYV